LNESHAARQRDHRPRAERDVVRALDVLLHEIRLGANERERVLDRGACEEAAMRIDDVVARVPEKRRRDAGDLDVLQRAVESLHRLAAAQDVADVVGFSTMQSEILYS
jgi:hypothetical protein